MKRFFNVLKELFIVTGLFTVFIGVLIYLFYYIQQNYTISSCGCKTPVQLVLIGLVVFGIFLGASISLFINIYKNKNDLLEEEKEKDNNKILNSFLKLVEQDERKVLSEIIKNNGNIKQSEISKNTGLSRVKTTRIIKKLVQKGVVRVESVKGKNIVYLSKDLL
ncbi:MAG: winged helix-turn-helix transcriptional regulator [Candidatus Woesearchaeota archaeon]